MSKNIKGTGQDRSVFYIIVGRSAASRALSAIVKADAYYLEGMAIRAATPDERAAILAVPQLAEAYRSCVKERGGEYHIGVCERRFTARKCAAAMAGWMNGLTYGVYQVGKLGRNIKPIKGWAVEWKAKNRDTWFRSPIIRPTRKYARAFAAAEKAYDEKMQVPVHDFRVVPVYADA